MLWHFYLNSKTKPILILIDLYTRELCGLYLQTIKNALCTLPVFDWLTWYQSARLLAV